jgi:hypothetical protein
MVWIPPGFGCASLVLVLGSKLGSGTDLGEWSRSVTEAFDCKSPDSCETAYAVPPCSRE